MLSPEAARRALILAGVAASSRLRRSCASTRARASARRLSVVVLSLEVVAAADASSLERASSRMRLAGVSIKDVEEPVEVSYVRFLGRVRFSRRVWNLRFVVARAGVVSGGVVFIVLDTEEVLPVDCAGWVSCWKMRDGASGLGEVPAEAMTCDGLYYWQQSEISCYRTSKTITIAMLF